MSIVIILDEFAKIKLIDPSLFSVILLISFSSSNEIFVIGVERIFWLSSISGSFPFVIFSIFFPIFSTLLINSFTAPNKV